MLWIALEYQEEVLGVHGSRLDACGWRVAADRCANVTDFTAAPRNGPAVQSLAVVGGAKPWGAGGERAGSRSRSTGSKGRFGVGLGGATVRRGTLSADAAI
jgi:hypothetical protein